MSVEIATTGDIAALYHSTREALSEHGTPAFGDNYQGTYEGLPVADSPNRYTMLLAGAALTYIREQLGAFTPSGMMLRGIREVRVGYEEPYYALDAEAKDADDAHEYNDPLCNWELDYGDGDIEQYVVEPGWDDKTGPVYAVKRSTIPRNRDERLDLSLTGLDEGVDGSAEMAAEASTSTDSRMSRRLAQTLILLTQHFEAIAAQDDALLAEALSPVTPS